MKKVLSALICTALILSGCGNMSNLAKGSAIGGGSGAAVGAGVGALIGKDGKSAAIGPVSVLFVAFTAYYIQSSKFIF